MVGRQLAGDIHAIEHVAHVVEHAGGDFGHACEAGTLDKLLMGLLRAAARLPFAW